jgi:CRP-like cAMP-binding protein
MSSTVGDDDLSRLLAGTELFKALPAAELAACARQFREVRFAKGQLLFARHDDGSQLYLIAQGRVRLAIASAAGRELSFQIATAGDVIGEIAVLDGKPRSADATALTPVVAYALERSALRELWTRHPAVASAIIAFLCWRLRDASERLEYIALYPLEVRLARFLLIALGTQAAPPGARVPLDLGFSQGELAMLLGASRPKINAALGELERAGALARAADRLLCDRARLDIIAQGNDA